MHYPTLKKYKITQEFGKTVFSEKRGKDYYYVFGGKHPGIDINMPIGEPIFAALPGWVYRVEFHRGMGKVIGIRYGNIQHLYAHLSTFKVEQGDWIREGQQIALSGNTGLPVPAHLHFELRDRNKIDLKDRLIRPIFDLKVPAEFSKCLIFTTTGSEALVDISIKFFGNDAHIKSLIQENEDLKEIKNFYTPLKKGSKLLVPF